jgi:hypothetical protein
MTEFERLIQYVRENVTNGWGSIYDKSKPNKDE